MAALHLVFTYGDTLDSALDGRTPGEPVVLIGEGVYALLEASDQLHALSAAGELVLLEPDARARGLVPTATTGFRCISYRELVTMTACHQPVHSWY